MCLSVCLLCAVRSVGFGESPVRNLRGGGGSRGRINGRGERLNEDCRQGGGWPVRHIRPSRGPRGPRGPSHWSGSTSWCAGGMVASPVFARRACGVSACVCGRLRGLAWPGLSCPVTIVEFLPRGPFLSILSSDGAWRQGDSVIISTTITRVPRVVRYRGKGFARGQTLQPTLTPVSLFTQLLG